MKISKYPIITICVAFLIICLLPNTAVEAAGKISKGSEIAGIPLEGLSLDDAMVELLSKVEEWQNGEPIVAASEYESILIPRQLFQFDIDAAIEQLDERMKGHWSSFFMKQKNVQLPLEVSVAGDTIDWPEYIDSEKTLANAVLIASNLEEGNITLKYIENAAIEQEEIAEISYSIPEGSNAAIKYLVEEMDGLTIDAESVFSFLDAISLPNGMDNSQEEMSFVASGLYVLALQTNLDIIERHQQEKVTSYAEAGLDVEVDRAREKNLVLYNSNIYASTVHASIEDEQMNMSIHSFPDESKYTYKLENKISVEPRTLYRYNPDFDLGEEKIVQEGEAGTQIEVYRNQNAAGGSSIEQKLISRDFYFPTPEIIEVSTQEVIPKEELAMETETPEEESNSTIPTLNFNSLADMLQNPLAECTADEADCETDENNPDKLMLACMTEHEIESAATDGDQEADAATKEDAGNPYCDLMYLYLFLSLFSNENLQTQIENNENFSLNEENPDDAVNDEEVQ